MNAKSNRGVRFKLPAVIIGIVAWNVPLLWGMWSVLENGGEYGPEFYQGVLVSLGLLFISSLGLITVESFRKLVLQAGYDVDTVRKNGWLTLVLSGLMSIAFLLGN